MPRRQIVEIDQKKCDGCGLCVSACAEGAIQITGGKAQLVSDVYCDGLGACLGKCPQDAITIVEREAADFDAAAAPGLHATPAAKPQQRHAPSGCPGLAMLDLTRHAPPPVAACPSPETLPAQCAPALSHWPIQLHLVPPSAPFLQNADLFLVADCVPFACGDFHRRILQGRPVLIGCPKLDDGQAYVQKLTEIFRHNPPERLTVVHMEVPCCTQLLRIAAEAMRLSGADIPMTDLTISRRGEILSAVDRPRPSLV